MNKFNPKVDKIQEAYERMNEANAGQMLKEMFDLIAECKDIARELGDVFNRFVNSLDSKKIKIYQNSFSHASKQLRNLQNDFDRFEKKG